MFDEMSDHFYHFLAATTTTPSTSFSLHRNNHQQGPTAFDPSPYSLCPPPPHQGFLPPPPPPLVHHHHHHPPLHDLHHLKNEDKEEEEGVLTSEVDHLSWSNDEMIALLRVRATLDNNWFPDFIWENVSRKLAELGFKRSAEKCKEKFEEETRKFSSNNNCITKNNCVGRTVQSYRLFGELEDLCNNHHPQPHQTVPDEQCAIRQLDKEDHDVHRDTGNDNVAENHDDSKKTEENTKMRKRKRQDRFEMFKEYCENIVNKMIAQQEQLHFMILRDMVKRDEEKIAREEAWKKEEIERIQNEMEVRAHELAIVGDRQAKIISLLNNFTSSSSHLESQSLIENLLKVHKHTSSSTTTTTSSLDLTQDSILSAQPTSSSTTHDQIIPNRVETSKLALSQNPNDHTSTNATDQHKTSLESLTEPEPKPKPKPNTEDSTKKDDIGRRWPRDEVLALINIRCSLLSTTSSHDEISKDDHNHSIVRKGIIPPLWERISQRMKEMGYKRNAKRCKEKWENINKYFRKTKDLNKKRSIDSRTCPYFHQLSHLYSQTDNQTLPGSPEIK